MEKAIGGYFELELPQKEEYHKSALRLNSGKNCIEYILRTRRYNKVYIPYYTCGVVLKPFMQLDINYQFYHIDLQFEIADKIKLNEGEALLYTNYYGLKQDYVQKLAERYGQQLIVDNTQAFFAEPIEGIDTFYTCRKFFGVPDGAYLYINSKSTNELRQAKSHDKVSHLVKRMDLSPEEGFSDFHKNEETLENEEVMLMSRFTERMMHSIDYKTVAMKRRENFLQLHDTLQSSNQLEVSLGDDAVPMIYPYMTEKEGLRENLIQNKVFVARYWPNVLEWVNKSAIEYKLVRNMFPLPIDQRYNKEDLSIIKIIIEDAC